MSSKSPALLALLFFSGAATANITLKGIFLDAAEQTTGIPLIVMDTENNTLVAQISTSQKETILRLSKGETLEISCPIETIIKANTADKEYMDYMANDCIVISVNNIRI